MDTSKMPALTPKPKSTLDDELDANVARFTTPEDNGLMSEVSRTLARDEILLTQPEHGPAYSAARKIVETVVEKCDTRPGQAAQLLVPAVAATCATAHAVDHLDHAYDRHLMGDDTSAKQLATDAGRDLAAGLGSPYHRAASSLVEAVRPRDASEASIPLQPGDAPSATTGDNLRAAGLSAVAVAAGGRLSGVIDPALAAGDAIRRGDVDAANANANSTVDALAGAAATAITGRVASRQVGDMVGGGVEALAGVTLPDVKIASKDDGKPTTSKPVDMPSKGFLSFLSGPAPAPAPKRLKLPTPWDDQP